jgi:hypothetical protein
MQSVTDVSTTFILSIVLRVIISLCRPTFHETETLHVINKSSDAVLMCMNL